MDGWLDGRTNDITISVEPFFLKCALKFIADFQFLGLFMAIKHDLSNIKISGCHAPLPVLV
jgi:hypothetical protein